MMHTRETAEKRIRQLNEAQHPLGQYLVDQLRIIDRAKSYLDTPIRPEEPLDSIEKTILASEHRSLLQTLIDELGRIDRNEAFSGCGQELCAAEFGARGDGAVDDGPALRKAIAAAKAGGNGVTLRIPKGTYRIEQMDSSRNHLLFDGLRDVVIAGEPGTTIVGTGVGTLLRVEHCHNITFKNLALDYDPLPFAQGVITEVYADECAVDWRLDSGFAPLTAEPFASKKDGFGGKILDIETGRVLSHHGLEIVSFVELGNGLFRLEGDPAQYDNRLDEKLIKVGTPLAVHTRGIEGRPPAVWVASCKHIDLYTINLYASYAHSYLLNDNEAIKLFNCSVEPRPGTNRLTVSNADGFHCRSNRQGPYFSGCKAWRNCDDTSNLYSRAVSVDHILDDTHFVLDARYRPEDKTREWQPDIQAFREGDLLAFIDPNTGNMDGLVTVRKMSEYDWHGHRMLMVEVSESLTSIKSQEDLGKPFPVPKNFEYLYKEDPTEVFEHFVVNLSTKSDGFVMRDCTFGENSVNGTKLKASHGIIENCEFLRHAGEAITFCMRLTWQEAFAARYIDVCNNLFDSHAGIDSTIDYPGPGRFHCGPSYMTGIRVTGNTFKGMEQGSFGLSLHNLRDSEFCDNEFSGSLTIFDDCQRLQFRGNTRNERS